MSNKPGVCDPLSDLRVEIVHLLGTLGIDNPLDLVRPIFRQVRQRYAGDRPYIPHTDQEELDAQRQLIIEGITAGLSVRSIAEQTGLPRSRVWRIKKEWAI